MSATTTATEWDSYCDITYVVARSPAPPTPAATKWEGYLDRAYAAAHPAARTADPDLLDFSFAVDHLRLEAAHLVRLLQHAEAAECKRGPVLRAHLADLRLLRDEAAALLAEAEAA